MHTHYEGKAMTRTPRQGVSMAGMDIKARTDGHTSVTRGGPLDLSWHPPPLPWVPGSRLNILREVLNRGPFSMAKIQRIWATFRRRWMRRLSYWIESCAVCGYVGYAEIENDVPFCPDCGERQ